MKCLLLPLTFGIGLVLASTSCRSGTPDPGDPAPRRGDEISIAGRLFHAGTPVVLWNDPGGFDGYRVHHHLEPETKEPRRAADRTARFDTFRRDLPAELEERVRSRGWTVEDLGQIVSQVVLHYDVCGTSRRCFEVLHDVRGLSCHFLLDVDGTIYQTLDVKERAWHAGTSNCRSIGIEIAGIGAYPRSDDPALLRWYGWDREGPYLTLPDDADEALKSRRLQPARSQVLAGIIQGQLLHQFDFTEEQYRALENLLVTLCRALPGIEPRVPRSAVGTVPGGVLPVAEQASFRGILGHYHVSKAKIDPGPAFDWERIENALRRLHR